MSNSERSTHPKTKVIEGYIGEDYAGAMIATEPNGEGFMGFVSQYLFDFLDADLSDYACDHRWFGKVRITFERLD